MFAGISARLYKTCTRLSGASIPFSPGIPEPGDGPFSLKVRVLPPAKLDLISTSDESWRTGEKPDHVAERTFGDKIIIIHWLRSWFEKPACCAERDNAFRVITTISIGFAIGVADRALGVDCAAHGRVFLNSADLALDRADPATSSFDTNRGDDRTSSPRLRSDGRNDRRRSTGIRRSNGFNRRP